MRWGALILVLSSLPLSVQAEPEVLYEGERTVAIDPYLKAVQPRTSERPAAPPPPRMTAQGFGLPVETPGMTPGRVKTRELPALEGRMAGASPFFLIGADRWSLQWLQENRARLIELGAAGLVVSVETERDLAILKQAAGDVPLSAMSGEAFAKELGIQHYPVLIAPPGIVTQ